MKVTSAIIIILFAVLFVVIDAHACSCGAYPDFLLTWMASEGAFQANVSEIEKEGNNEKIHFDISLTQKGMYSGLYIHEQYYGNTCNVDYAIGETYQVFMWPNSGNSGNKGTDICSTKQITGFNEYSHEDEYGNVQHYREDYNFFTQYNLFSLIIPVAITAIIVGIIVWRKRK